MHKLCYLGRTVLIVEFLTRNQLICSVTRPPSDVRPPSFCSSTERTNIHQQTAPNPARPTVSAPENTQQLLCGDQERRFQRIILLLLAAHSFSAVIILTIGGSRRFCTINSKWWPISKVLYYFLSPMCQTNLLSSNLISLSGVGIIFESSTSSW